MERKFHKTEKIYNIDLVQRGLGLYKYASADFFFDHHNKEAAWVILRRREIKNGKEKDVVLVQQLSGEEEIEQTKNRYVENGTCSESDIHIHDIDCATVYFYDHNRPSEKGYVDLCYIENIVKEKVRRTYRLPKEWVKAIELIVHSYRQEDHRTVEPFNGYNRIGEVPQESKRRPSHTRSIILKAVFLPFNISSEGYSMKKNELPRNQEDNIGSKQK